jgi:SHS2 domain-containing protein
VTYRWVDHTAEVELAIEAASEREVFEDALHALAELLDFDATQATSRRRLTVAAPDRPALLATWLEELVFLAESEGFVATEVLSLDVTSGDAISATVAGAVGDPPPLVKAVTYHRLAFDCAGDRCLARVVLDV